LPWAVLGKLIGVIDWRIVRKARPAQGWPIGVHQHERRAASVGVVEGVLAAEGRSTLGPNSASGGISSTAHEARSADEVATQSNLGRADAANRAFMQVYGWFIAVVLWDGKVEGM